MVTYSHNLFLSWTSQQVSHEGHRSAAQFEGSCHLISRPPSLLLGDQVVKLLIQFCLVFGLHHCTLICSRCHLISRLGPLLLGDQLFFAHSCSYFRLPNRFHIVDISLQFSCHLISRSLLLGDQHQSLSPQRRPSHRASLLILTLRIHKCVFIVGCFLTLLLFWKYKQVRIQNR